tara:strand:+ start:1561 stop:1839 length:279 start_codon:yes stop_codon:yes gene_type:complete
MLNSGNIYTGMKMNLFCDQVLMTPIYDDPCRGNKNYFSSKKAMILYSQNAQVFFVFSSVSSKNINIFNYNLGRLDLITNTYAEADFYIKNLL